MRLFRPQPFLLRHFWLATVQDVLHALWQDAWHSPQPVAMPALMQGFCIVVMCFIVENPPIHFISMILYINTSACTSIIWGYTEKRRFMAAHRAMGRNFGRLNLIPHGILQKANEHAQTLREWLKNGRKKQPPPAAAFFVNSLHAFGNGDGHGDGCADHGVVAHADEAHHLNVSGEFQGRKSLFNGLFRKYNLITF